MSPQRAAALNARIEEVVAGVDLECTGMDDHDPEPCPKCEGIRTTLRVVCRRVILATVSDAFTASADAIGDDVVKRLLPLNDHNVKRAVVDEHYVKCAVVDAVRARGKP